MLRDLTNVSMVEGPVISASSVIKSSLMAIHEDGVGAWPVFISYIVLLSVDYTLRY